MSKRRFYFLTNEDALVFTAKVNTRRDALRHYEAALDQGGLTEEETAFLVREKARLNGEIARLMA